ncbi:MAG: class I SAM-dependent rRNA methyltransferase [Betaproteobacteria bacterium]|jgi:23S rRNA (cytosine1962-C5)-methyltransferase
MQASIFLEAGKEHAVLHQHPWIFANTVARYEGKVSPGTTVSVFNDAKKLIGRAAYSPHSQIRARMWTWDPDEPIDHAFFKRKIAGAIEHRQRWVKDTNAIRLIFGEADGLPGLVVDQYDKLLVCQFLSAGADHWKEVIVQILAQQTGCESIYERSDAAVRQREGLELHTGLLFGKPLEPEVLVQENGIAYLVDPINGHKTGFYIDQRDNRRLVMELAENRSVLNMFCYTGGFSLAALKGGARHVTSVDSSGDALTIAKKQTRLNEFDENRATWLDQDAFETLKNLRVAENYYDLIVLDPPKFAPSAAHLPKAIRAYKEINRTAMQMVEKSGLILTFSCSGAMDMETFEKTIFMASKEASSHQKSGDLKFRVLKRLTSGLDHPKLTCFPEGDYLKGLLLERI